MRSKYRLGVVFGFDRQANIQLRYPTWGMMMRHLMGATLSAVFLVVAASARPVAADPGDSLSARLAGRTVAHSTFAGLAQFARPPAIAAVPTEAELRRAVLLTADLAAGFVVDHEGPLLRDATSYLRGFNRDGRFFEHVDAGIIGDRTITPETVAKGYAQTLIEDFEITGVQVGSQTFAIGASGWVAFFAGRVDGVQVGGGVLAWWQGEVTVLVGLVADADSESLTRMHLDYARRQERKIAAALIPTSSPPVTTAPPVSALPATAPPVTARPSASVPPTSPANLVLNASSRTSMRFQWSAAAGAETYFAYAPYDGGFTTLSAGTTSFTLNNLAPNSYHCLIVIAQNNAGYSGWSNWVCAYTPP